MRQVYRCGERGFARNTDAIRQVDLFSACRLQSNVAHPLPFTSPFRTQGDNQTMNRVLWLSIMLAWSAARLNAATLSSGPHQVQFDTPNTYDYAPAVLRSGATTHAWVGSGIVANGSPYNDVIRYAPNWTNSVVSLCPTYGGANEVQHLYPNCQTDYNLTTADRAFDGLDVCPRNLVGSSAYATYYYLSEVSSLDWTHVLDPAVVKVGGQFYMYFDAPRTGPCDNGVNGQIFLAQSTSGIAWTKYPSNSVKPQAVIPYFATGANGAFNVEGTTDRYGIGEPSVVFNNGLFHMYYTYNPWMNESTIKHATSTDGVSFTAGRRIFPEATIPGGGSGSGIEVRYIPAWDLWFLIHAVENRTSLRWNISRDGVHWLPYNYRAAQRTIGVLNGYANSPAIEGNEYGHIGDASLLGTKTAQIVYGTGTSTDPLTWKVAAATVTLSLEPATGHFDEITFDKYARGWAHDPDAGVNDAAANGEPSAPLHLDTFVRPVVTNIATGQTVIGAWQSAEDHRADLVAAGVAPDPYHGFRIDLKAQGFPAGTYDVRVEAGEFPVGAGGTMLTNTLRVTLP